MRRSRCMGLVLLILPVVLSILACSHEASPGSILSHQQIVEIANQQAVSEGFNPAEMDVLCESGNRTWRRVLRLSRTDPGKAKHFSVLDGRNYQAVRYSPKQVMLGGVLWVFVDRHTGEVITWYGEE